MRRILVERARKYGRIKHGGRHKRVPIDDVATLSDRDTDSDALLALDESLKRLEALNPRQARVVGMRHFAGLTIEETARAMDVSPATIKTDWLYARAWLHRDMTGRWFDEIYSGAVLDSMTGMYRTTVTTRRPARFTGRASFADKDHVVFETLHLPMRAVDDPDGPVRMILGGAVLEIPDRAR